MSRRDEGPGTICVVGSLNVDTTLRVPALPRPGETVLATGRSTSPGGKGANQAVAAAALGGRVRFVGAVGSDDEARAGLANLAARGIDTSGVQQLADTPTGTAVVVVDGAGENLIVVDPGANGALDPAWVTSVLADAPPNVVLAQLEVPVPVLAAVARSGPRLFILNPAPVPPDVDLRPLLEHVDVLVPNRSELGQLAGTATPRSLEDVGRCAARLALAGTLVVTLGRDGAAVVRAAGEVLEHVPAPVVEPVDTTGAGDAFCGVLARELARPGADLSAAVRRAVALAASSTLHRGAQVPETFGRGSGGGSVKPD